MVGFEEVVFDLFEGDVVFFVQVLCASTARMNEWEMKVRRLEGDARFHPLERRFRLGLGRGRDVVLRRGFGGISARRCSRERDLLDCSKVLKMSISLGARNVSVEIRTKLII